MGRLQVIPKKQSNTEIDLFADKSGLILYWLLKYGENQELSVREISRQLKVSLGLTQRVVEALVKNGVLSVKGVRTSKEYGLKNPAKLFRLWLNHYDLLKKCKVWTYDSGFSSKEELMYALKQSKLKDHVTLTLHSAADALGFKNTNIETLELYIDDLDIKDELESKLDLTPKERGYQVLLVKPYYKAILEFENFQSKAAGLRIEPELLAVLDLFHFPLRGREQAEQIIKKTVFLKGIYEK